MVPIDTGSARLPRESVLAKRGTKEVAMDWPKCLKCNKGVLIPLSDYGQEGASVLFKAWVCTNPECGFSLRVDKGEVTYGKKIDFKH
jgi:hypothetical protein